MKNKKVLQVEPLTSTEIAQLKKLRKDGAGLRNLQYMFKLNSIQEVYEILHKKQK